MEVDKFRLIEEVRKRPFLWDCQKFTTKRNNKRFAKEWADVAKVLNIEVITTKRIWHQLRVQFCNEAIRVSKRIAKDKSNRTYSSNKKYYRWAYFDALRFVAGGRAPKAKFDISYLNDSDQDMVDDNSKGNETQNQTEVCLDSNSYEAGTDSDIEIVDNKNEMEFIATNLQQSQKQNLFGNDVIPIKKGDNTSQIMPLDDCDASDKENGSFKSYTFSLGDFKQEPVKEEPEFQIEAEMQAIEKEDINEFQLNQSATPALTHYSEDTNLITASNDCEHPDLPIFPKKHVINSCDQDYIFLYSFLSTTKLMSQLQKREFHGKMKSLLLNIFPASSSVNILEKLLLLPEDNDPDRKFLMSFWPFIKSMSLKQNLQFRSNMSDLFLKIISSETNL